MDVCAMRVRTQVSRVMRQSMSGAELRVWVRIRGRRLDGWKFRRQHPIGPYYVDFYCPAARLVIEVDGPSHWLDSVGAYDERRQAWLTAMGYRVLRIPVDEIDRDVHNVIEWIEAALEDQERRGLVKEPLRRPAGDTSP